MFLVHRGRGLLALRKSYKPFYLINSSLYDVLLGIESAELRIKVTSLNCCDGSLYIIHITLYACTITLIVNQTFLLSSRVHRLKK